MNERERWSRIEEIFEAAIGLPEEEQVRVLDRECGGDAELRRKVEALVRADRSAGRFIESTIALAALVAGHLPRRPGG